MNVSTSDRIAKNLSIVLTALKLALIDIPLLLILLVPCLILRSVSKIVAEIFRKDLYGIFHAVIPSFALDVLHRRPKAVILNFLICDGPVCLENLQSKFLHRVINFKNSQGKEPYIHLKHHWVNFMGYLYWKKENNFQVTNHVRMYDYTNSDCWIPETCTEEDLQRIAGYLLVEPFVKDTSPWELLVIPNYIIINKQNGKTKIGTVLAFRIHHAMADGYSIVQLYNRLLDYNNTQPKAQFGQMSKIERLFRNFQVLVKIPWDMATLQASMNGFQSPWNPIGTKMTRKYKVFLSGCIPLDTLKRLAKSYGVTYNAVIYSVGAGAVVKMMKAAGVTQVPPKLTSTFAVPLPGHPGGLNNHASFDVFSFFPHEMNAQQRLRHIGSRVTPARVFKTRPLGTLWLIKLLSYMPTLAIRAGKNEQNITFGSTSMPCQSTCIQVDVNAKGFDMWGAIGTGRGPYVSGIVSSTSLAGNQRITYAVDLTILSSSSNQTLDFSSYVQEEIDQLLIRLDGQCV